MTNKIYRLANIDRDEKKLVYYCNAIAETPCENKKGILTNSNNDKYRIVVSRKGFKGGHILHGNKVIVYTPYAFVEVTLADFNDFEFLTEMSVRAQRNPDGIFGLLVEDGKKFIEKNYDPEKSNKEYLRASYQRVLDGYKQGYEASKKEFEPKWINVTERLPIEIGQYWCASIGCQKCGDDKPYACLVDFNPESKSFVTHETITHWMPLSASPRGIECECHAKPDDSKICEHKNPFDCNAQCWGISVESEKKALNSALYCQAREKLGAKYTCVQCGKSEKFNEQPFISSAKFLCSRKCYEDYQWIPAEFPRDKNKSCRVVNDFGDSLEKIWSEGYEFLDIAPDQQVYIVLNKNNQLECKTYCQVRRDSVGENK